MARIKDNSNLAAIIAAGGSVVRNGQVITDADDLPSDEEILTDLNLVVNTIPSGKTTQIGMGENKLVLNKLTVNGTYVNEGVVAVHNFDY